MGLVGVEGSLDPTIDNACHFADSNLVDGIRSYDWPTTIGDFGRVDALAGDNSSVATYHLRLANYLVSRGKTS